MVDFGFWGEEVTVVGVTSGSDGTIWWYTGDGNEGRMDYYYYGREGGWVYAAKLRTSLLEENRLVQRFEFLGRLPRRLVQSKPAGTGV